MFNAANEAAVDAFCDGRLGFLGITETITRCLDEHLAAGHVPDETVTVDSVLAADRWGRQRAAALVGGAA